MNFSMFRRAWLQRFSIGEIDRKFTAVYFALPGIAGSVVSFLNGGIFIWAMVRFAAGTLEFRLPWRLAVCMAVFVAYFAISLFTILIHGGGWPAAGAILDVLPFLFIPLIAARLRNTPGNDLTIPIFQGAAVGAAASGIFGTVQNLFGWSRVAWRAEGGAGNAGPFAAICVLLAFLSLGGFLTSRPAARWLATIGFAGGIVGFYMSGSRGLVPAVPILLAVFGVFFMVVQKISRARIILGAVIVALVGVAATPVVFYRQFDRIASEPLDDFDSEAAQRSSIGKRVLMYSGGLSAFVERPLFGHGPQNRMAAAKEHLSDDERKLITFSHLHNLVLDHAVGSGIAGVLSLLLIFITPLWSAFKTLPDAAGIRVRYMTIVVLGVYFVHGLTNLALAHDIMVSVFVYSIVAILCSGAYGEPDRVWLRSRRTQ